MDESRHPPIEFREFCQVVDWDAFQYTETRKVPKPPWKWFRIQMTLLRSWEWNQLTKPLRADFIALLGAASETGNLIPTDRKWLRARDISPVSIQKLVKVELCRLIQLAPDDPQIRNLRRAFSGVTPPPEAEGEAETDTESEAESPRQSDSRSRLALSSGAERRGAGNSKRDRRTLDSRSFDELKLLVSQAAAKLGSNDGAEIHKLAGQSLRMTRKQTIEAVRQLRQDGDL